MDSDEKIIDFTISNELWENYDRDHLKELLSEKKETEMAEILSKENLLLWQARQEQEDILVEDTYNLEANRRVFLFEISIYTRIEIMKKLKEGPVKDVPPLDTMNSYKEEMIRPITEKTLEKLGKPPVKYGISETDSRAQAVGEMRCILVKEHDEMLFHFLNATRLGVFQEKKIVIHFDAHSDMGTINEEDLPDILIIKDIKELRNWFSSMYYSSGEKKNLRTPITLASFLHYAVKKDMIKEIFWVLPTPAFSKQRLPENLDKFYVLNIEEGDNFRLENGLVTCDWQGIKVRILRLADLPEFTEDVIVDIDMDYFINLDDCSDKFGCRGYKVKNQEDLAYWYDLANVELEIGDVKPWIKPEDFCKILKEKNIKSILTFISLSPHFTQPYYHDMIDIMVKFLGKPLNKL